MATRPLWSALLAMATGVPPSGEMLRMAPEPVRLPSASYVEVKTTSVPLAAMPPTFFPLASRTTGLSPPLLEPPLLEPPLLEPPLLEPPLEPPPDPLEPPLDPPA